jgi:hypothetical protein
VVPCLQGARENDRGTLLGRAINVIIMTERGEDGRQAGAAGKKAEFRAQAVELTAFDLEQAARRERDRRLAEGALS